MASTNYRLTLLYDGACAVCRLEMDELRARDDLRKLVFVDISQPDFDAGQYGHVAFEDLMTTIHGVKPDGSLVTGVDALQLAYRAIGRDAWLLPLRLPLAKPLADRLYAAFARNRYAVSAAFMPVIERIAAKHTADRMRACHDGRCATGPEEGGAS